MKNNFLAVVAASVAMMLCTVPSMAQSSILDKVAKQAKNKVEQRVNTTIHQTESKAKIAVREAARKEGRNAVASAKSKLKMAIGSGKEYYVSSETGSNRNDGSIDAPFKNIMKALEVAPAGATIYVAEGNYFGVLGKGNIDLEKSVNIIGGFSSDFEEHDFLTYRTFIQPDANSNGTQNGQGTMQITSKDGGTINLYGLIFDRGYSISYNKKGEGWPEGVESPMMCPIGTGGIGGPNLDEEVHTTETSEIYFGTANCNVNINSCAFVNAPNFAIRGTVTGAIDIENCIFVNVRMAAVEIPGGSVQKNSKLTFKNNTVLFVWSRLKDLGDMGYGVRYATKCDTYIDHNIIGCCTFAGIDRTHVDSDKNAEAKRVTTATDNIFFLNKQGDLTMPGGGLFLRVKASDFEEVEQLKEASGNKALKDPSVFKGRIDTAYLDGFLNVAYTESTDYNPNSAANTFRSAMGMNMVGSMQSSATMFANRYNIEKALSLFGAVEGFGAQAE